MLENIVISNPERLEGTIQKISEEGLDKFHVLSDFDRTLTKAFVQGEKSSTVIAQIRNGNYLTPEYSPEAHRLFDVYHPIEVDSTIGKEERSKKMREWWQKHFDLLIRSGLNRRVIEEIVRKRGLRFREGALELIDQLHRKNIPLVIMSAGPGDMVAEYLKQENRLYENVHIIANFFEFDAVGTVVGVREPIIHSLNKHEIAVQGYPVFESIKNRKNVLLLGDGLDDVGMVEGFDYENLIKIGFLNEDVEANLEKFQESFDVVVTNDGSMEFINNFIEKIEK